MERKLLTTAVCAVLFLPAMSTRAQDVPTQDAPTQDVPVQQQPSPQESERSEDAVNLDRVVVTGSRIPRSQIETASPVTTITAEDIQRQGFRNVSDVLRAQPLATGSLQDNQFAGSFTANATTVSLLGLSPSFTLILLDGRPIADYPLLYNGQSNFTDLTSIPTAMVERIDILPGNQSSIYGSAAIAGVVNIILKKHLEGVQLNARIGGYSEGGGDNERLQLTGGNNWNKLDLTWGLQYSHQDPIYMRERDFTDTTDDNPNPNLRYGSRTFIILNGFTNQYDDPGTHCDALGFLYGGTTRLDFRPGRGNFCGSRAQPGFATLLNEERGISAYLTSTYHLSDDDDLYATVLVGRNKAKNDSGSHFWVPDINGTHNNFIWNQTEQTLETYQRIFAPEEQGNDNFYDTDSDSYNVAFGIKGALGASNWDYDAYYSRSGYKVTSDQLWPVAERMEQFFRDQFLGPQLGTYYGYPVYAPDKDAFYQALTPAQYHSFVDNIHNESSTWTHNVNLQLVNGSLFHMPAGDVGFAAILQAGKQHWDNPIDPGVAGDFFFGLSGTSGKGDRTSEAIGVEFNVPLLKSLTANIAGRYDSYKNVHAGSDSKGTYKLGLEFRPIESLLFRANYATAFRAPDMGYIFTGGNGFFTTETDFYKCEIDPGNCALYTGLSVEGNQVANPDLQSITAKSWGYGVVWAPSSNFDLRADYYNVKIEDEVVPQSTTQTLFDENECRQGRLDPQSARCIDALARVQRLPVNPNNPFLSENLDLLIVKGINIAEENVSGITAAGNYRFDNAWGRWQVGLEYNLTLKHETRTFPDQPTFDLFSSGQLLTAEFKSIVTGDLGWERGKWRANLHATRYGSTPNYARQFTTDPADPYVTSNGVGPGRVRPWMLYNLSVDYQLTKRSGLSVIVNNIRNSEPPFDASYDGSQGFAPPFYNIFAYNGYGRSWWVEYKFDFGGGQ
ncbi:TonB-dependent receptor plug domain-containing protein [Lysobacter tyrosinilyticus]